ncbi:hypothetical protein GGS21DRAFT_493800 [Xylaria nigripes]|nr:hypothetical protein GGS21DRAFT_493800 [Xylaria nigripes]
MLPTPVSSTEIKGQDYSSKLFSLHSTFELPPSALAQDEVHNPTSSTQSSPEPSNPMPYLQPSETVKSRRRTAVVPPKELSLPMPPTRSCRIIQMKPRQSEKGSSTLSSSKGTGTKNAASKPKKQQPSATSASGRKIARKTAHSLIERRRRSRMNEEFAILKGLIPDCEGEMHKLAILQAAIEYVHYLKDCKTKLEIQNSQNAAVISDTAEMQYSRKNWQHIMVEEEEEEEMERVEDEHKDMEMTDIKTPISETPTIPIQSHTVPISPALTVEDVHQPHHQGLSSPQTKATATSPTAEASTFPQPQVDIDREASAALLMLHTWQQANHSSRGLSVQDLLSP